MIQESTSLKYERKVRASIHVKLYVRKEEEAEGARLPLGGGMRGTMQLCPSPRGVKSCCGRRAGAGPPGISATLREGFGFRVPGFGVWDEDRSFRFYSFGFTV